MSKFYTIPTLAELPPAMLTRARWASERILNHPAEVEFDEEDLLAWVYHEEDGVWYSIAGNYSSFSPTQKAEKRLESQRKTEASDRAAEERFQQQQYWSKVRQRVLERDGYICQWCRAVKGTKLHIHHILKRVAGGSDHEDNLITVCPKCHKKADTTHYNPAWQEVANEQSVN